MTTLLRVCLTAAALSAAMAATAAAQTPAQGSSSSPGQIAAEAASNSMIMNYRTDPNSFIDQPPPWPGTPERGCRERTWRAAPSPKVVRTMPAPGSVVRPGSMVLSVTFDQPMACKANLANGSPFPIPCPGDKAAVVIAADQRTLTTVCEVEAQASYSMPIADFVGVGGAKSERYELSFTTSADAPITDARAALALEKAGPVRR